MANERRDRSYFEVEGGGTGAVRGGVIVQDRISSIWRRGVEGNVVRSVYSIRVNRV
jgi:hypothetical protein